MILQYVIIFIAAIVLSMMKVSIWLTYLIILSVFLLFRITTNPLYFSKNPQRMMNFLQKSKQPNLHFMYLLYSEKMKDAENILFHIRSENKRSFCELMLYTKQKKISEAKRVLEVIINPVDKYYHALLALHANDSSTYETFKSRVKNSTYRIWLEAEEARCNGDIQKAIRMIDEQMPKLRGLKLLSASEYRKELEQDLALAQ